MPPASGQAVIKFNYEPPGPTLAHFRDSDAFARCIVGPMHGGRRVACVYDVVLRSCTHPDQFHWRWAAIRATLDELETYTLPAWQRIVPPAQGRWDGKQRDAAAVHVIPFGIGREEVGRLEVIFLAMDQAAHRKRLATLELTAAWLDSARDLPQAVFEDVLGCVGQYPSQLEGGCDWSGVILSTRPPAEDHWIPGVFERERRAGYALFRQPSGRSPQAENLQHLPRGLYQRAVQGKPADWVRVNIDGQYGLDALERDPKRRQLLLEADAIRERCRTLSGFVAEAWPILEPSTPFVHSWHVDAVCEHLEGITRGEIQRLQINMPPGCMKSLIASVMWEAWEWGPAGLPGLRYLTTSYQEGYARRDARKHRDLVQSEWYRTLWPDVALMRDNEIDFENTHRGARKAVAFASLTSGRGNRLVIDDPHSTETAESDPERERATRLFRESATSRLNDPKTDAILVIMHRLHPEDICGVIEQLELPYVKLVLPMEYVRSTTLPTKWFTDPRTADGELLCPERLPRETIEQNKRELGPHAYANQYQQLPRAREGSHFFSRENLLGSDLKPVLPPQRCDAVFAVIDSAVKTGRTHDGLAVQYNAFTKYPEPRLVVLDWDIGQIEGSLLEIWLPTVIMRLEALAKTHNALMGSLGIWIEDKASGTILLQQAQRKGWQVHALDGKLTAVGKDGRAISVSGYVYRDQVKVTVAAHDKTAVYKGRTRNHFLYQVLGYRMGAGTATDEDDLFDTFCYSVALAFGNSEGLDQ